ncbi:hypothetical protein Bca52824_058492 [Brassica carinata]|uniref:RNase H type-1 domain-containing protein n=1 Tax=Brassica carinata TaxID=52824 RepID=A0A8X7QU27_BRACI|nr:hypothetical protein Bca52824_058492 [Brassica carinata]
MDDKEIWAFNNAGDYSVKSGCWILRKLAENAGEEGMVQDQAVIDLKKQIWRMSTIPKIRKFLWGAASGGLGVAERLTAHGMHVEITCKLCHQGIETIEQVLFQCTKAQKLWSEFDLTSGHSFNAGILTELLNECLRLMKDEKIEHTRRRAILWMLWTIWKNRNSLIYAEVQVSHSLLVQTALEEATLWHELNRVESSGVTMPNDLGVPKQWTPPTPGLVKCNFHAIWRNNRYHSGGAWITWNHMGAVGMHTRDAFAPSPDKLSTEMECLLWVLRSLRDLRLEEVSIGTDSSSLLEAIKNPSRWPRYRGFLSQIAAVCTEFEVISFEVESSDSNQVARKIAKSVLRDGRFQSYLGMGGPSWLHDLIRTEVTIVNS